MRARGSAEPNGCPSGANRGTSCEADDSASGSGHNGARANRGCQTDRRGHNCACADDGAHGGRQADRGTRGR